MFKRKLKIVPEITSDDAKYWRITMIMDEKAYSTLCNK
jgi:hypothetical protein